LLIFLIGLTLRTRYVFHHISSLECQPLQIGHFTLNNAESNTVALEELKELLDEREVATILKFDPKNHHIRCYAHIVNICCSHIIVSMTSTSTSYLGRLKVPSDREHTTHSGSDGGSDDDDDRDIRPYDDNALDLPRDYYKNGSGADCESWLAGIRLHDPLKRARNLIRILRSSDTHRTGLQDFIVLGNDKQLFTKINDKGEHITAEVPRLQLLRDVKTRWDSVFLMLRRLRHLRPVSQSLWHWSVETNQRFDAGC
jgi:hypothetical protein